MYPQNNKYRTLIILGVIESLAIGLIIYSMAIGDNFIGRWLEQFFPCELPCSNNIETGETLCPSSPGAQCLNNIEIYAIIALSIIMSTILAISLIKNKKAKDYTNTNKPIQP